MIENRHQAELHHLVENLYPAEPLHISLPP
jgi:hypothetical protein